MGSTPVMGRIFQLWRSPVKSMLGERRQWLTVEQRGVQGDRLYAVRDADGKFGSGKNTRRFRKIDGLFGFAARHRDQLLEIHFPSGIIMGCHDAAIHSALSAALGQPVVLAKEADIYHLDAGPIHILTSASLAWLRAALPDAGIDERRFRPNLVVDLSGQGLVEQEWIGRRLRVGREVQLEVTMGTERCGMITFSQSELAEEPSVLRHITREAGIQFGVYAEVIVSGSIQLNDPVAFVDN